MSLSAAEAASFKASAAQARTPFAVDVFGVARLYFCKPNSDRFEYTDKFGAVCLGRCAEKIGSQFVQIRQVDAPSTIIWQFELYYDFSLDDLTPTFCAFETDVCQFWSKHTNLSFVQDCIAGLSFADSNDAASFKSAVGDATPHKQESASQQQDHSDTRGRKKGFWSRLFGRKEEEETPQEICFGEVDGFQKNISLTVTMENFVCNCCSLLASILHFHHPSSSCYFMRLDLPVLAIVYLSSYLV